MFQRLSVRRGYYLQQSRRWSRTFDIDDIVRIQHRNLAKGRKFNYSESRLRETNRFKSLPKQLTDPFPDALVHRTGEMNSGSCQYLLLPPTVKLIQGLRDPELCIASLFLHRNVIFGARLHPGVHSGVDRNYTVAQVCPPLLEAAVQGIENVGGDQPQAMSTLYGLCRWVMECLLEQKQSQVLQQLKSGQVILDREGPVDQDFESGDALNEEDEEKGDEEENNSISNNISDNININDSNTANEEDALDTTTANTLDTDAIVELQLQAIHSLARGEALNPSLQAQEQHVRAAWKALATEFAQNEPSEECRLYQNGGADLIGIQHMADSSPKYLSAAGGAMARFFFT